MSVLPFYFYIDEPSIEYPAFVHIQPIECGASPMCDGYSIKAYKALHPIIKQLDLDEIGSTCFEFNKSVTTLEQAEKIMIDAGFQKNDAFTHFMKTGEEIPDNAHVNNPKITSDDCKTAIVEWVKDHPGCILELFGDDVEDKNTFEEPALQEKNWKRISKEKDLSGYVRVFDCKPYDDQVRAYVYEDKRNFIYDICVVGE